VTQADITHVAKDLDGSMVVRRFCEELAIRFQLPGLISLHRSNGVKLTDEYAYIGDVITTDKTVRLRYDETVAVANGATASGAQAYSSNGGMAFAGGGYAEGGRFLPNGTAQGGRGIGGDAWGDGGQGGFVFGGGVNNPGRRAEAGDMFAGRFFGSQNRPWGSGIPQAPMRDGNMMQME